MFFLKWEMVHLLSLLSTLHYSQYQTPSPSNLKRKEIKWTKDENKAKFS